MSESLRIVIQVFDHKTMQQRHGGGYLVLSPEQIALVQATTDQRDLAEWAREELSSIISCLETVSHDIR